MSKCVAVQRLSTEGRGREGVWLVLCFLHLYLHLHSEGGGGSCFVYGFAFDDLR